MQPSFLNFYSHYIIEIFGCKEKSSQTEQESVDKVLKVYYYVHIRNNLTTISKSKGEKTMMYSEFIKGTGCKDNKQNYKVFANLEIMYMYSDMTKEEIYEYGRKLVDNSKSETELAFERQMKVAINEAKQMIEYYKKEIATAEMMLNFSFDPECWQRTIKESKEGIKIYRMRIQTYKNFM